MAGSITKSKQEKLPYTFALFCVPVCGGGAQVQKWRAIFFFWVRRSSELYLRLIKKTLWVLSVMKNSRRVEYTFNRQMSVRLSTPEPTTVQRSRVSRLAYCLRVACMLHAHCMRACWNFWFSEHGPAKCCLDMVVVSRNCYGWWLIMIEASCRWTIRSISAFLHMGVKEASDTTLHIIISFLREPIGKRHPHSVLRCAVLQCAVVLRILCCFLCCAMLCCFVLCYDILPVSMLSLPDQTNPF